MSSNGWSPLSIELIKIIAADPELPPLSDFHYGPTMGSILRKRNRGSSLHENSSDPPLFSSDDLSASVENYTAHRAKRVYQGPWWSEAPERHAVVANDKTSTKRTFQRNFDSGVWMGSDDSQSELDTQDPSDELTLASDDNLPLLLSQSQLSAPFHGTQLEITNSSIMLGSGAALNFGRSHSRQQEAINRVQRYVDEGLESVDLADLNLGEIQWSTLSPLRYLTIQPTHHFPPSREAYQSLTPNIRLYLANNELSSLPSELYSLYTIRTLSLRSNKLESLSPAVANLVELEDLNIGSNSFRFLPWEILQLLSKKLTAKHLHIHPNPLARPISPLYGDSTSPTSTMEPNDSSQCVAATSISYLDIRGSLCAGASVIPSQHQGDHIPLRQDSSIEPPRLAKDKEKSSSHVPSLLEHVLRVCTRYPQLEQELHYLERHGCPLVVHKFLERAAEHKISGGVSCSVCGQEYVIPRTEWVEWYPDMTGQGSEPIPFLRRGCSWHCVPDLESLPSEWKNCGWSSS